MPRLAAALTAALLLALAAAAPALARVQRGQCLGARPGIECFIWTGRVTFVDDGDTINVDVDGDGRHGSRRIRITGINTQEQTVYSHIPSRRRGECHALAATARMDQLIRAGHDRVRLYAMHPASHSGVRPRRAIGVRIHGRWVDVGSVQLADGNALWLPNPREWAWNRPYSTLAERASERRRAIWNPTGCGRGPDPHARLRLIVNWDAPGDDLLDVNGEWVNVINLDPRHSVHVGRWVVRGSDLRRFHLPRWATIPAGGEITVHVGHGPNSGTVFHWGLNGPIFDNANPRVGHDTGDGAYLFDPRGNLRAWMMYPCRVDCIDPLRGRIALEPHYAERDEYVVLRNVSISPANLEDYSLSTTAHDLTLPARTVLGAGERLRVYMDGAPSGDSRLVKYWGLSGPSLKNGGDRVELTSPRDIRIACVAWGGVRC